MATVLQFGHTDYTLKKRIERACLEHEREMMKKAGWMYQFVGFEPTPCITPEDWENYLEGWDEI